MFDKLIDTNKLYPISIVKNYDLDKNLENYENKEIKW